MADSIQSLSEMERHGWIRSNLSGFVYTYHSGLRELRLFYVLNFLISVSPMGFLTTWVYVKNNRSMLACIIFHLFVNTMQEKIAMTPQTKCVETIVVTLAAVLVVLTNKEMFFEREHIGNLLHDSEEM